MLAIALVVVGILFICFTFVIVFGAPYLPTLHKQSDAVFELLDLDPGQHLLELGCGDGRILREAAQKGLYATGYELNPFLWLIAVLTTWKYRSRVRVVWGNYWHKTWPETEGIYVFLLDRYMTKLHNKFIQEYDGKKVKLVSYAFQIKGLSAKKQIDAMYLYEL